MNALIYLHTTSFKNRILSAIRSPKRLLKAFILIFAVALFTVGAITGGSLSAEPVEPHLIKGMMFLFFLLPYWAGRFGGIGPFEMADVNFVFTSPIVPRTVLLVGLMRRLWGMLVISFAAMIVFSFMATIVEISIVQILLVGLFCLILTAVCQLLGMYMFVAYKKAYRWIGFFWMLMLLIAGIFYAYRAGWEWMPGLLGLLDSYVFTLTPLVGWAAAGAFAFMTGHMLAGLVYTSLLLAAGGYFFVVVYRSVPDFYEDALGVPATSHSDSHHETGIGGTGIGAAVFFHKHIREASRASRAGIIGTGTLWWAAYAIIWGWYARGSEMGIEIVAMVFGRIGVPSGNILAVLTPLIFVMAIYPQFDRGFMELYSPYFYLAPERPSRKLLWISMARIINICVTAVLVLGLAGVISGTAPDIVLAAMLAYVASSFMVLGLRVAMVRLLGVVSGAGQKLVSTLPVVFFVLVGWIGILTMFFFGAESWGLLVGLLGFTGWCVLVGALGFLFSLKVLHDVDAPV